MRTIWQNEAVRVGSWKKDLGLDGVRENMVGTLHTNPLTPFLSNALVISSCINAATNLP